MALNNIMNIVWPFNRRKLFFVVLIIFEEDSGLARPHHTVTVSLSLLWPLASTGCWPPECGDWPGGLPKTIRLPAGPCPRRLDPTDYPPKLQCQPALQTHWLDKNSLSCYGPVLGDWLFKWSAPGGGEPLESRAHGPMEDTNLANCLRMVINNWMLWNTSIKL